MIDWKKFNETIEQATAGQKLDVHLQTKWGNPGHEQEGIHVWTDSTLFIMESYKTIISPKELTAKMKKVASLCREMGIKLQGRKHFNEVIGLYDEAKEQCDTINKTIDELKADWEKIVADGVYIPTSDNKAIDAATHKRWDMEKLTYRNTAYSRYNAMTYGLDREIEKLEDHKKYNDGSTRIISINIGAL